MLNHNLQVAVILPQYDSVTAVICSPQEGYVRSDVSRKLAVPKPLTAPGQLDGIVVIFDIETNGVARKLRGHTRQVQSLRYALRQSTTGSAILTMP